MRKSSTIYVNELAFSIVLIQKMSSLQNTHEIILYTVMLEVGLFPKMYGQTSHLALTYLSGFSLSQRT